MVFKIALNRCCCDEGCDALADVCRVTVAFQHGAPGEVVVDNPVFGDEDPTLDPTSNEPSPAGVCSDCTGWNREFEVFAIDCPLPNLSGGPIVQCVMATGQAGDGFSVQPQVYPLAPLVSSGGGVLAQAGSTCFPCHDFLEDAGLVLTFVCDNNLIIGAKLRLYTPNAGPTGGRSCEIVAWGWDPFRPEIIDIARRDRTGAAHRADEIDSFRWFGEGSLPFTTCYTPRGSCVDPEELFPCFTGEEVGDTISRFYDTKNCIWKAEPEAYPVIRFYGCKAEPPPLNPVECDDCITLVKHVIHAEFAGVGGGIETPVSGAGRIYVEENYWDLTEDNGEPGELDTEASGDVLLTFPCRYEVFLRYHFLEQNDFDGEVRIFNITGSGAALPAGFVGTVFEVFELEPTTDIDGDHNTDFIDGFLYRKLVNERGTTDIYMNDVNDQWVRVEIEGPSLGARTLRVDDLLFRRL